MLMFLLSHALKVCKTRCNNSIYKVKITEKMTTDACVANFQLLTSNSDNWFTCHSWQDHMLDISTDLWLYYKLYTAMQTARQIV